MARAAIYWAVIGSLVWCLDLPLAAQQVSVSTPRIGVHDSYYEHFNIGWGLRWRGRNGSGFFQFGGAPWAVPPFGGYNPNADARLGIAQHWGNADFFLNFAAGAGRQTTMTMNAPSLTVMNGYPGFIQDVTLRPFVVGLIPVVGGYPVYPVGPVYSPVRSAAATPVLASPVLERWERLQREPKRASGDNETPAGELALDSAADTADSGAPARTSTAARGDVSLAEIRRELAAGDSRKQRELDELIAEARAAERGGQAAIARVRYQQAAAKAAGQQKQDLLQAAARLKSP